MNLVTSLPIYFDSIIKYLNYHETIIYLLVDTKNFKYMSIFSSIILEKKFIFLNELLYQYDYLNFSYHLSNLPVIYLDKLLFILLNEIKLPTIWKNRIGGYYDIRYLFDLIYHGGRISIERITNLYSTNIFNLYYDKIIQSLDKSREKTIDNLLTNYSIFFILDKKFIPYQKYKTTYLIPSPK